MARTTGGVLGSGSAISRVRAFSPLQFASVAATIKSGSGLPLLAESAQVVVEFVLHPTVATIRLNPHQSDFDPVFLGQSPKQCAGSRRHLDVDPIAQVAVVHVRSGSSLSVGIAARRPGCRPVHLLNLAIDRVDHGLRQLDVGFNRQMQSLAVEESPEPVVAEAERFERPAAIRRGERFSQSAARREPGKKLQCVEEVALARSVRSEQDREPRKLDLHVTQRLVAPDVDSLEHLSRCPAPNDGISGAVWSTMAALIIRLIATLTREAVKGLAPAPSLRSCSP